MDVKTQYPLANLTTFHIGGPADFFVSVASVPELQEALGFAKERSINVLVLGRGSNVLISDDGFRGLVIKNDIRGLEISDSGEIYVRAGENWDDVVAATVDRNFSGIECLSGVPGSAGGALVQNIGAYGQTLSDLVMEVDAVEVATGAEKKFSIAECEFVYRGSWFKQNLNKFIVTGFRLRLKPNGLANTSYPDVAKQFSGLTNPSLSAVRETVINIRGSKGYLISPRFESYNTAGSFFKNPIVTREIFEKLEPIFGTAAENRFWPAGSGVKLAAAFLVQEAGFAKGYTEGQVGISPKHSLSIINLGSAKAAAVKALDEEIKEKVFEKFGVRLEEEVLLIGKF